MKAMFNKVLVVRQEEQNENQDGIILSESSKEKFCKGIVKSKGDLVENIKEGDVVWYDKNRASKININGESFDAMDKMNIFVVD